MGDASGAAAAAPAAGEDGPQAMGGDAFAGAAEDIPPAAPACDLPLRLRVLQTLGVAYIRVDRHDAALRCVQAMRGAVPQGTPPPATCALLAVSALCGLKRYEEAEDELSAAVAAAESSQDVFAAGKAAQHLLEAKRPEPAAAALCALLEAHPACGDLTGADAVLVLLHSPVPCVYCPTLVASSPCAMFCSSQFTPSDFLLLTIGSPPLSFLPRAPPSHFRLLFLHTQPPSSSASPPTQPPSLAASSSPSPAQPSAPPSRCIRSPERTSPRKASGSACPTARASFGTLPRTYSTRSASTPRGGSSRRSGATCRSTGMRSGRGRRAPTRCAACTEGT